MTKTREIPVEKKPEYEANRLTYFDRVNPDAHFGLPAHPTVKHQLDYWSAYTEQRDQPLYVRMWHAAKALIQEWDCALLPNMDADLAKIDDPAVASHVATIVMWAGNQTLGFVNRLEEIPKN